MLWGVDLGGTKIEAAIVDPVAADRALWRVRIPTESELGYAHIIDQVRRLIVQLEVDSGLTRPGNSGQASRRFTASGPF